MVVIQSLIIVALALIVGATFPGGVGGVAVLFAVSALLGATFGGAVERLRADHAPGGGADRRRAVHRAAAHVPVVDVPGRQPDARSGSQHVADFNPVNWAVMAGRAATSAHPDWGLVASRAGVPGGAARAVPGVRDERVPVLSAVGLSRAAGQAAAYERELREPSAGQRARPDGAGLRARAA